MKTIRTMVVALTIAVGSTAAHESFLTPTALGESPQAGGAKFLVNRDKNGVALHGYDPVAYFTASKPVKGDSAITAKYEGASYWFASEDHRALFQADPAKYAPAYGGYCGYAASINRLSPVDPEYWQIVDGRLVLQHNQKAFDLFNKDVKANSTLADTNWPSLVDKNGTTIKVLVNVDDAGVALMGYDPVAYFTDGVPTMGTPEFTAVYDGAIYHFVSMDHRVTFESDPAKYAPQFGGFCGYAASINKVSPVDPKLFQIIDGRLVLQHTEEAYRLFNKDAPKNLAKADKNWPGLVQKKGK